MVLMQLKPPYMHFIFIFKKQALVLRPNRALERLVYRYSCWGFESTNRVPFDSAFQPQNHTVVGTSLDFII